MLDMSRTLGSNVLWVGQTVDGEHPCLIKGLQNGAFGYDSIQKRSALALVVVCTRSLMLLAINVIRNHRKSVHFNTRSSAKRYVESWD